MQIRVEWNENSYTTDVSDTESDLWKEVAKNLPDIPIPNTLTVQTPYGDANLSLKQRGTYIKDGVTLPSMYVTVSRNSIYGLASSIYKDAYLTCVNPESNNYKYYHLKPRSYGIDATYGRIGSERGEAFGTKDLQKPYESYLYWIRYYEKLSKGYVDQTDVYLAPQSLAPKPKKKTEVPGSTDTNTADLQLFQQLKAYARHVVKQNFKSTAITPAQVKKSKEYLKEMGKRSTVKGFNAQLEKLLMVCPRKARYIQPLLAADKSDFADIISREENLVAAMEAVAGDASEETLEGCFKEIGIQVFSATKEQEEQVLSHLSDNLKPMVKSIYRVINQKHAKRFNDYLNNHHIRNVKQLWHGSRNENWFSILENGLQLHPDARITGKMFGDGIYFAPSSMKSWNYTSYYGTSWGSGTSDTGFMGLYATAYGKPLDVQSSSHYSQQQLKNSGYNCVHAHAGTALHKDEIIYYSEAAMILNYIVEFK